MQKGSALIPFSGSMVAHRSQKYTAVQLNDLRRQWVALLSIGIVHEYGIFIKAAGTPGKGFT